jgi:Zn finger protein HypA/HybF involved in hydrogenase expression
MFKCQECGRKFRTVKAAEKAADQGCPGCGGSDIDVDTGARSPRKAAVKATSKPQAAVRRGQPP